MKITIESTTKLIECTLNGQTFPARIWEGHTDSGIPVHCYVARIAVEEDRPPADYKQFENELKVCRKPSPAVEGIPLRCIL